MAWARSWQQQVAGARSVAARRAPARREGGRVHTLPRRAPTHRPCAPARRHRHHLTQGGFVVAPRVEEGEHGGGRRRGLRPRGARRYLSDGRPMPCVAPRCGPERCRPDAHVRAARCVRRRAQLGAPRGASCRARRPDRPDGEDHCMAPGRQGESAISMQVLTTTPHPLPHRYGTWSPGRAATCCCAMRLTARWRSRRASAARRPS